MISSLVFLIVGGAFVLYLFKGLFALINTDFNKTGINGKIILNLFKIPLVCFLLLLVYVIWGISFVESLGYK